MHLHQQQEVSGVRLFMVETVPLEVGLVSMVEDLLSHPRLRKGSEVAVHLEVQHMMRSLGVLLIKVRANNITVRTKVASKVREMT
jgi:hypothetical protein